MDDDAEIELKKICCTCLSIDRKLMQLCKINDGVNNLYFLLSYDAEAYKEGFFKDLASLHICWECRALIQRIVCFRLQACGAQRHLSSLKTKHLKSLSKLSMHHKTSYDDTVISISISDNLDDNFIDCDAVEVKTEIDDEDVPLSQLHSLGAVGDKSGDCPEEYRENKSEKDDICLIEPQDNISDDDYITKTIETNTKIKKENPKAKNTKKKTQRNSEDFYKTVSMNEKEMLDERERRKLDVAFSEVSNKCESCVACFRTQIEFEEHNVTHHSERPDHSICDVCLCYVPTISLSEHRNNHLLLYTCLLCEHNALSLDDVVKHLGIDHGLKSLGVTVKRKEAAKILKLERRAAVTDKRTPLGYQCTECNKYFENKNQRWKHIQRFHREGYRCHTCGKRFAFKHSLGRHELLHSVPPPREECPTCQKMIRVDLLKAHSLIHSPRESFSCAACDKTFVSRASYHHHLKYTMSHSNTDILKYKCSFCDKGYRSRGELRDHENYQHKGHTRHQCPICGKALATRRCITRHVRRAHDGVKESARDKICQQCGKAFRDKKGLREHELIHTGERPLSCEVCGCSFRQSASLYTHRKRVHKIHAPRKLVQLLEEQ